MTVSISVVIPAYNRAIFLPETLKSVFNQSLPPSEVIVVDDGSTDDTGEVLRAYGSQIRTLRQGNRGVSAARNAGVAMASGELLAFLDADDVWHPRKLERQAALFSDDPQLGLVHCGVEEVGAGGEAIRTRLDGMEGWVSKEMLFFRRGVILGGGSAAVVVRAVFESVGGFDQRLSTSADWDLYYRIAERLHGGNMHGNVQAMANDMLIAYAKAFSKPDPGLERLRRSAYGGLHSMLAGSYFRAGDYRQFVRHALASVRTRPEQIGYFAAYPVRALRRCLSASRVG
jgi:glycosyltransferase involved in cell wall biosynthesis